MVITAGSEVDLAASEALLDAVGDCALAWMDELAVLAEDFWGWLVELFVCAQAIADSNITPQMRNNINLLRKNESVHKIVAYLHGFTGIGKNHFRAIISEYRTANSYC
jgi:hypothetical protein